MSGRKIAFVLAFTCVLFSSGTAMAEADTLSINVSQVPPFATPERDGFEDSIATEMYARMGFKVRFRDVPAERGLQDLDHGIDDGTLARNPGMANRYPNLVQFNEPVLERHYVAFSKGLNLDTSDWTNLADYRVGIVIGWKILERNITKAKALIKVRDSETLFRMLEGGRIDVAVFNKWGGLSKIEELGIKGLVAHEPPFAKRSVYYYVHKSRADLAARGSAILREMKADGTYQRIFDATLGTVRTPAS